MAKCIPFDARDKAAFEALDKGVMIVNDETAIVTGEMELEIVRPDGGDQFWLQFTMPNGERLDVRILRRQLLEQLNIAVDES